jgi:hypothetical protein
MTDEETRDATMDDLAGELHRLTVALHTNKCHPDFEYRVALAGSGDAAMIADGYEPCPEAKVWLARNRWWRRRQPP